MPFVWYVGTIIGPSIGGTFSDPHQSLPTLFPSGCLFDRFPYLLPNVVCAALLLTGVILGYFLLEETHPDFKASAPASSARLLCESTYLVDARRTSESPERPNQVVRYGTFAADKKAKPYAPADAPSTSIWGNGKIFAVLIALSIFTYHSMTYDQLMPIFLEDDRASPASASRSQSPTDAAGGLWPGFLYSRGGLGLSIPAVGGIMAVDGAIALFVQAVIFPLAAELVGVRTLFMTVTILHPVSFLIVPLLAHVPERAVYPGVYACLAVRGLLSIIAYPLLLILIKAATPVSSARGMINGLAASAGAVCRMIAPPVAGLLYSIGSRHDCTALAWLGSAAVAAGGAVQCFWVDNPSRESVSDVECRPDEEDDLRLDSPGCPGGKKL